MTTIILISIAAGIFLWYLIKSRKKTKESLKIAKGLFISTAIQIVGCTGFGQFVSGTHSTGID